MTYFSLSHFPIYMKVAGKRVCLIGNGDDIIAKARLVAKSDAQIEIYADAPDARLADYLTGYEAAISHYDRGFVADDIHDGDRAPIAFVYLAGRDDGGLITPEQAAKMPEIHWVEQAVRVAISYRDRVYAA